MTPAQRRFLQRHRPGELLGRYDRGVNSGHLPTYDFVGRCRNDGLIEIVDDGLSGWPWSWKGTRITEAGVRALSERSSK